MFEGPDWGFLTSKMSHSEIPANQKPTDSESSFDSVELLPAEEKSDASFSSDFVDDTCHFVPAMTEDSTEKELQGIHSGSSVKHEVCVVHDVDEMTFSRSCISTMVSTQPLPATSPLTFRVSGGFQQTHLEQQISELQTRLATALEDNANTNGELEIWTTRANNNIHQVLSLLSENGKLKLKLECLRQSNSNIEAGKVKLESLDRFAQVQKPKDHLGAEIRMELTSQMEVAQNTALKGEDLETWKAEASKKMQARNGQSSVVDALKRVSGFTSPVPYALAMVALCALMSQGVLMAAKRGGYFPANVTTGFSAPFAKKAQVAGPNEMWSPFDGFSPPTTLGLEAPQNLFRFVNETGTPMVSLEFFVGSFGAEDLVVTASGTQLKVCFGREEKSGNRSVNLQYCHHLILPEGTLTGNLTASTESGVMTVKAAYGPAGAGKSSVGLLAPLLEVVPLTVPLWTLVLCTAMFLTPLMAILL